jgi:voltage-gated potassium channel Kch
MDKKIRVEVIVAASSLLGWIGVGTFGFKHLEGWSWVDAFYFSVVTITTVGFGDLTPSTDLSKVFTAIYILIGVSIGVASLGIIGSELIKRRERRFFGRK